MITNRIEAIQQIALPEIASPARHGSAKGEFNDILKSAIQQVDGSQVKANDAIGGFLSGEQEDPHSVALAVQRAELDFDMFMQVRGKVVSAYQEVMRMQI